MIIWLSSYPKSGNTWIRSIISALEYTKDGIFNPDCLKNINRFPSKTFLKSFTNNFQNIHEMKKLWCVAQDKINLDQKIKYLKTHSLNCKIDNFAFTNKENTLAIIYIIRDPQNVVTSLANHYSLSIEKAKNHMFIPFVTGLKNTINDNYTVDLVGSWSDHIKSWTNIKNNLLIIKYEDLVNNIEKEINKLIEFINKFKELKANKTKIINAIESTSFENLKKFEDEGKFNEGAKNILTGEEKKNFYLGKKNNWKEILDLNVAKEIENKFKKELFQFNYLN